MFPLTPKANCPPSSAAATTTEVVVNTVAPSACPKCGATKIGKPSCCARDGAWAGKCAAEVSENFEHTWAEGFDACTNQSKFLFFVARAVCDIILWACALYIYLLQPLCNVFVQK